MAYDRCAACEHSLNPRRGLKHEGWQGYGHWLGTGNQVGGKLDFLPFKKALLYARSLKLKSKKEWEQWCKIGVREANMPSRPDLTYKHKGWQGYGHWLGTGNVAHKDQQFLPFKKALLYARSLKLKCRAEWEQWRKTGVREANMPSHPDLTYKHAGWQGYGHWLGTGTVAPKYHQFLPFKKALQHARSLKLKGQTEWRAWRMTGARPANIPSAPQGVYKHDGWQGYGHWLGTGTVAPNNQQLLPFKKALVYARSLNLKSEKAWRAWRKSGARPANIPSTPDATYKHDVWQGWGHWLGTGAVATQNQQFLPFKKALLHARSLKLKGVEEWKEWCKSGENTANLPAGPDTTYKHEGWNGYGHWLGTGTV